MQKSIRMKTKEVKFYLKNKKDGWGSIVGIFNFGYIEDGHYRFYQQRIGDQPDIGPFLKLLLVRCLRVDRIILACKEFICNTKEMGPAYVEPITDTIEMLYESMVPAVPVIFLSSSRTWSLYKRVSTIPAFKASCPLRKVITLSASLFSVSAGIFLASETPFKR